MTVIKIESNYY